MLSLHGLIWSRDEARAAALLGGEAEIRRSGRLSLIVGAVDPAATATPEGASIFAVRHNILLSRLAAEIDVLPARLGEGAAGAQALRGRLAARRPQVLAALRRVSGAAEYSLTFELAGDREPNAPPSADESGYLRRKLQARRARDHADAQRRALLAQTTRAAEAIARDCVVALGPSPARPQRRLGLSLLLDRSQTDALAALGAALAPKAEALGLSVAIVGPWPAYSFAAAADAEAA